MMVYEKIYFKAYINNQYIWHKNSTEYFYLILERAELRWTTSSLIRDAPDIHRFRMVHMVETYFL